MPTAVAAILHGIILGIGAAAPIGPVNVQIARRTLRGGFRQGFFVGCGAVTVDVVYASLSSMSLRGLTDRPAVVVPLTLAGAAFLAYLGVQSLRAARDAWRADPLATAAGEAAGRAAGAGGGRGAYLTGLLMTLLNPMTLAFWFVAVPGSLGGIGEALGHRLPAICAGVFIGTLGWVVAFAGAMSLAGRYRGRGWLAGADAAGGATLLFVAAGSLWSLAKRFL